MHVKRPGRLLLSMVLLAGCSKAASLEVAGTDSDSAAATAHLLIQNIAAAKTDWSVEPQTDDWPWWRGPDQDGKAKESSAEPPTTWSTTENVIWRTPLTGRGHASPVLWGNHIFLANADEEAGTQSLVALARQDGKPLWTTTIQRGELPYRHEKNSHASATPACDGRHVYLAYLTSDGLWVTAVDFDGKMVWQTKAGPFQIQHGYGSSLALHGPLVFVAGDNEGPGYLAALDRQSGEIAWRTPRTEHPSYGTPIVTKIGDRHQLLLSGGYVTTSYDPLTGRQLWQCEGPTQVMANTMAVSGELVFASGGYPDKEILAIRASDSADSAGGVVWRTKEGVAYVPSPLAVDGRLYVVTDNGVANCFAAETGKVLWKKRLGGDFTASPVFSHGKIYVGDEAGTTHVIEASDEFKSLAKNSLQEEQYATPTIVGGRIYLRTIGHLYCLGQQANP
jgi:outer membrane protein assembly factor BamB